MAASLVSSTSVQLPGAQQSGSHSFENGWNGQAIWKQPAKLLGLPRSSSGSSAGSVDWLATVLVVLATLLVLEQSVYRYKKKHLPGAKWTIPVIGKFADSLKPTMQKYKSTWSEPLSVASVFNIFIVMAADNSIARKILNSPNHAEPCLVASAKQILIPENWVFLGGKEHADYRKALNILFTRRSLSIYLKMQETIYREYFAKWLQRDAKATATTSSKHMMEIRDLNMETSLRVFCGNYLPAEACKEISDKYWLITRALELVNFPLAVPGTKVYKAIKARKIAMNWFMHCSAESKKRMKTGVEAECLLDQWVKEMHEYSDYTAAVERGEQPSEKPLLAREYSDHEIGMVLMSFLFASQDAMSSGLIYAFQFMADHADVAAKIRQEQMDVRAGDLTSPFTLEMLDQSPYLRAFVKETLRLRPPVIMVPYYAKKAFPVTDNYVAPKGSIVIPSFWNSLHDPSVYSDPDSFLPERWLPGGQAEKSDPRNYLVFGSGPHKCIGYDYALMHIAATIGTASLLMDWQHDQTPLSDDIEIICTLFPKDGCKLRFSKSELAVKQGVEIA